MHILVKAYDLTSSPLAVPSSFILHSVGYKSNLYHGKSTFGYRKNKVPAYNPYFKSKGFGSVTFFGTCSTVGEGEREGRWMVH